jgi:hypothetical protein
MNRRQAMMLPGAGFVLRPGSAQTSADTAPGTADKILLKDYHPTPIYNIPKTGRSIIPCT